MGYPGSCFRTCSRTTTRTFWKPAGVEVPTTWDELTAACKAIKEYDDSIYPWGIDMTTDEGQAAFAYYTWNNGGGFVDDDGNWTLNSPENVEAIEYAISLVNDRLHQQRSCQ